MQNIFSELARDTERMVGIEGDPIMMATLHALRKFVECGHSLSDLPWFKYAKAESCGKPIKKAA